MNTRALAAGFIAAGFAVVSYIFVVIEPEMGFTGPGDYFNPDLLLRGGESTAWLVGDLIYLGFCIALSHLGLQAEDRVARASGVAAGILFFFIGCTGRVIAELPGLVSDPAGLEAALMGLLAVRFAALRTTVFALGVFAWRSVSTERRSGPGWALWRASGYLVLVASIGFAFVFLPVPLLFTLWAVGLAVAHAKGA